MKGAFLRLQSFGHLRVIQLHIGLIVNCFLRLSPFFAIALFPPIHSILVSFAWVSSALERREVWARSGQDSYKDANAISVTRMNRKKSKTGGPGGVWEGGETPRSRRTASVRTRPSLGQNIALLMHVGCERFQL